MVLPKTTKQDGTEVVSMYMPSLTDHLPELDIDIVEVKRVVKEMGGKSNASCRFLTLSSTPEDTAVTSKNSHVCRSVIQIPRKCIATSLLSKLDASRSTMLILQLCINYTVSVFCMQSLIHLHHPRYLRIPQYARLCVMSVIFLQ